MVYKCIYMESRKIVPMNLFAGQQWETENRLMDMGSKREEGEGEMYGESNMETYITICRTDSQWEFALWLRELKQGLCINLEGWDREGVGERFKREGTHVYLWLIYVDIWQKTTKFYKAIILQLKIINT